MAPAAAKVCKATDAQVKATDAQVTASMSLCLPIYAIVCLVWGCKKHLCIWPSSLAFHMKFAQRDSIFIWNAYHELLLSPADGVCWCSQAPSVSS